MIPRTVHACAISKICPHAPHHMEWALGGIAAALVVIGLVGQGFEMKRINSADEQSPANIFADRRNFKWYATIGAGMLLWLAAERL